MRALTVVPGSPGTAAVETVPEPAEDQGEVLVRGLLLGVCGTDREIVAGQYGAPPPGEERLVLGHESLGRVVQSPATSPVRPGDLVVGIVRRPDPVPCRACAAGEWDMCQNGRFTERGIVRAHGYGSEYWRIEPGYAVRVPPSLGDVGVLLEPASVLAKAWEQVDRISARGYWTSPKEARAMVTGAGPIGLMACLLGVQRGYEVHVVDVDERDRRRQLVEDLGAHYHVGEAAAVGMDVEVVIECTGLGAVGRAAGQRLVSGGIMCLTGIMNVSPALDVDATALNRRMVLNNQVLFGSVNAGRRHWEQAIDALAAADAAWLERLLTRRVPLRRWPESLRREPDDVKVVLELGD